MTEEGIFRVRIKHKKLKCPVSIIFKIDIRNV